MTVTKTETDMFTTPRFALCINTGNSGDLHRHTIYQVLPDEKAAEADYLRIVDESGEDYLYPASYFILLDLPPAATEAVLTATVSR